ncbi:MAG: hypothetical protein V3R95_07105 [Dehalococcoidia bacterium]
MSQSPSQPENDAGDGDGRSVLGRFARKAARAARRLQREAEEHRPAAERAAREAAERLRNAADAAKPEVERLARGAKAAADAALPHIERAAKDAIDYTREHQDQIRGAAGKAGRVAARGVTPAPLRPALDAFEQELTGQKDSEDSEADSDETDEPGEENAGSRE